LLSASVLPGRTVSGGNAEYVLAVAKKLAASPDGATGNNPETSAPTNGNPT
jgi:hypothetical protein